MCLKLKWEELNNHIYVMNINIIKCILPAYTIILYTHIKLTYSYEYGQIFVDKESYTIIYL